LGPLGPLEDPSAKQCVVRVHVTPVRPLAVAPSGSGLSTIDHFAWSHRSTNVFPCEAPTARHFVALVHDTAENPLVRALPGFGLSTRDQRLPSHRATNVLVIELQ
jgi:hypothetical protein